MVLDFRLSRRHALGALLLQPAAALLSTSTLFACEGSGREDNGRDQNHFVPSTYPDPRIEVIDSKRFKYKIGNSAVERIAGGSRWAEGPVYIPAMKCLLWSDAPNNRIMRWLEEDGHVGVFRSQANYANGNTTDKKGRLISCEHGPRRVTRTEYDGTISVLADRYKGKRFNAPNDVVVDSKGAIWFTDPGYGIEGPYEGFVQQSELPRSVYRIDPAGGGVKLVADDVIRPNGLTFAPDESLLYIVNSASGDEGSASIRVYEVRGDSLGPGRVFVENFAGGTADGIKVDAGGNLWCAFGWGAAAENGVRCYAPDGTLIGKIHLPELCANLCFGGKDNSRLFMAASTSIYSVYLNDRGIL
ncbi:MAG: SMP-30/gluconolactonase/LRE family protein [Cyanobacteria bacterium REEB67]|nr:SMP-30/gluconolactonase/LRE family protein [Cyanobacteria bacterium REEB67]